MVSFERYLTKILTNNKVLTIFIFIYQRNLVKTKIIKIKSKVSGKDFEFVLFFMKQITSWDDEKGKVSKNLSEMFINRLFISNYLENFLYTFYNPLKIAVLIIEFLQLLS